MPLYHGPTTTTTSTLPSRMDCSWQCLERYCSIKTHMHVTLFGYCFPFLTTNLIEGYVMVITQLPI
jgi:hypothetical protein